MALPWIYPYTVDEDAARDGREVLRPIVQVRIPHPVLDLQVQALVDSGCDHIIIAPWLARALDLPKIEPGDGYLLGLGGDRQWVRPERLRLQLLHPDGDDDPVEWEAEVLIVDKWRPWFTVLLGQKDFFDRFTITMHRGVQAVAIDRGEAFEERHGALLADGEERAWTDLR